MKNNWPELEVLIEHRGRRAVSGWDAARRWESKEEHTPEESDDEEDLLASKVLKDLRF